MPASADGFMAYSCEDMKGPVVGYELTPQAGCWMRPSVHGGPKPKEGRILWMRDKAQFPIKKDRLFMFFRNVVLPLLCLLEGL